MMTKYTFRDGTPYEGDTITTPDGRVLSGSSYTRNSKVLVAVVEDVVIEDTLPSDVEPPAHKKKSKAKKKNA